MVKIASRFSMTGGILREEEEEKCNSRAQTHFAAKLEVPNDFIGLWDAR